MLCYIGLFKGGRVLLSQKELELYKENLPKWQEAEYKNLDCGRLPTKATFQAVVTDRPAVGGPHCSPCKQ